MFQYDSDMDDFYLGPTSLVKAIPLDPARMELQTGVIRGIDVDEYAFNRSSPLDQPWDDSYNVYLISGTWTMNVLSQNERPPFPIRITIINKNGTKTIYDFYQVQDLTPTELLQTASVFQLPFRNGCQLPVANIEKPHELEKISFTANLENGDLGTINTKIPHVDNPCYNFVFLLEKERGLRETGVVCEHKRPTETSEVGGSDTTAMDYSEITLPDFQEWHDLTSNIHRCDETNDSRRSVIRDLKHGITYTLRDTCVIQVDQGEEKTSCPGDYVIGALIMYEKNSYFIGETIIRGIPADVWETIGDGTDISDVARLYFSKPNVAISENNQPEHQILLRVEIKTMNASQIDAVSVYDYYMTTEDSEFSKNFNIEDCQSTSQYVEMILFPNAPLNVPLFLISNAIDQLTRDTRANLLKVTKISPLRLPYLYLDMQEDGRVIVTAKILEAPQYLSSFLQIEGNFGIPKERTPEHSQTPEGCAELCIKSKGSQCEAMLICGTDCYIISSKNASSWNTTKPEKCTAYTKAQGVTEFVYRRLDEVTDELEYLLPRDPTLFRTTVEWMPGTITTFSAREFHAHLRQFDDESDDGTYRRQLTGKSIDPQHPASLAVDNVATVGECYRECIKDTKVPCASFSICDNVRASKCVLSSLNIFNSTTLSSEQNNATMEASSECAIYTVSYLRQFEHLPGKTRVSITEVAEPGDSAGECALLCRQMNFTTLTQCRSFNFCPMTKTCTFYDTHYAFETHNDVVFVNDTDCDHYALHFIADYAATGKFRLKNPITTLTKLSPDECAKHCSEEVDGRCKSFSYCDGATCYLYNNDLEHDPEHQRAHDCTMYMRHADIAEIIRPTRQEEKSQSQIITGLWNPQYTSLFFAMLATGFLTGVVGVQNKKLRSFLRGKDTSSSTINSTISYSRHNDDRTA
ncbi:hypothetical protein BIW11_00868 [Tropilaelaps mercedesae]|uniref:Apple domain-containing protein n=1 Tax=Tropilaelaps mercedesae TaxID=418985 RepID=A0A1V9XN76_9ACAR|nr:hypothetical protein BIW11_00868 [Tropilaelaps mercedesae]